MRYEIGSFTVLNLEDILFIQFDENLGGLVITTQNWHCVQNICIINAVVHLSPSQFAVIYPEDFLRSPDGYVTWRFGKQNQTLELH